MAMTSSAFCNLDTAKTMDVSLAFRREVQTEAARLRKGFIYLSFCLSLRKHRDHYAVY
jgi:hypothetical protein